MSEELKPCPFCGGDCYDGIYDHYCENLECEAHKGNFSIKQWNTRPLEDALQVKLDELLSQLHKAEERYIFLQKQIIQLQTKLEIAVDGIKWIHDLFVENGEYNEATEKANELLAEIEKVGEKK